MDRRGFLATTGAILPFLPGCIATSPGGSRRSEPTEHTSSSDSPDATSKEEQPSIADSQGPTRGESDVEIEVEEIEDDETVEYVEEDHAVRYVAGWRHTNHGDVEEGEPPEREPFYETTPFERWGRTQCLTAAGHAAAEHVNDELGTEEVGSGISNDVAGEDLAAYVSVRTVLDRDGEPVRETSVEFDALVAATPETVHVSYHLDDQEYRLGASVYARYDVLQEE